MNFFSLKTNDQRTIGNLLKKENLIEFDRLSWHRNEVNVNDLVFLIISGDSAKKEFEYINGLYAIGRIVSPPKNDITINHFKIEISIQHFLPKVISKDDFYLYPSLLNAPNIGPETKQMPNQVFRKLDIKMGLDIILAINDFFNYDIIEIEEFEIKNIKIEKLVKSSYRYVPKIRFKLIDEFIKWFNKPENYKKSYEGLIKYEILQFWDELFFNRNLFIFKDKDVKKEISRIENIIIDKKNLDWNSYSFATSKGSPEAILGKNNYLKFLHEKYTNLSDYEFEKGVYFPNFNIHIFKKDLNNSKLLIEDIFVLRFISSLLTKPFVILTGLSGSGKTKLAQAFVQWITVDDEQYRIIPVGADWTNRDPLLGYPNALLADDYKKPENGVLDLLIRANENPDLPYFLVLDEMNLSHVERYFADFLSVMESGKEISLHASEDKLNGVPSKIKVPANFFIIGTVNIDETTHMFSPKVLDRANTIEFRISEDEMINYFKQVGNVDLDALTSKGSDMASDFLKLSTVKINGNEKVETVSAILLVFFSELKKTGAEFGYRTASEILRLIHQLGELDDNLTLDSKIDIAIMQKLLPKLHGSRRKLSPVLIKLGGFCVNSEINVEKQVFEKEDFNYKTSGIKYPLSLEKITRMYKGAVDNGFTSFAEA